MINKVIIHVIDLLKKHLHKFLIFLFTKDLNFWKFVYLAANPFFIFDTHCIVKQPIKLWSEIMYSIDEKTLKKKRHGIHRTHWKRNKIKDWNDKECLTFSAKMCAIIPKLQDIKEITAEEKLVHAWSVPPTKVKEIRSHKLYNFRYTPWTITVLFQWNNKNNDFKLHFDITSGEDNFLLLLKCTGEKHSVKHITHINC